MSVSTLEFRPDEAPLVLDHVSVAGELSDDGHQRVEVGTSEFAGSDAAGRMFEPHGQFLMSFTRSLVYNGCSPFARLPDVRKSSHRRLYRFHGQE